MIDVLSVPERKKKRCHHLFRQSLITSTRVSYHHSPPTPSPTPIRVLHVNTPPPPPPPTPPPDTQPRPITVIFPSMLRTLSFFSFAAFFPSCPRLPSLFPLSCTPSSPLSSLLYPLICTFFIPACYLWSGCRFPPAHQ